MIYNQRSTFKRHCEPALRITCRLRFTSYKYSRPIIYHMSYIHVIKWHAWFRLARFGTLKIRTIIHASAGTKKNYLIHPISARKFWLIYLHSPLKLSRSGELKSEHWRRSRESMYGERFTRCNMITRRVWKGEEAAGRKDSEGRINAFLFLIRLRTPRSGGLWWLKFNTKEVELRKLLRMF